LEEKKVILFTFCFVFIFSGARQLFEKATTFQEITTNFPKLLSMRACVKMSREQKYVCINIKHFFFPLVRRSEIRNRKFSVSGNPPLTEKCHIIKSTKKHYHQILL